MSEVEGQPEVSEVAEAYRLNRAQLSRCQEQLKVRGYTEAEIEAVPIDEDYDPNIRVVGYSTLNVEFPSNPEDPSRHDELSSLLHERQRLEKEGKDLAYELRVLGA